MASSHWSTKGCSNIDISAPMQRVRTPAVTVLQWWLSCGISMLFSAQVTRRRFDSSGNAGSAPGTYSCVRDGSRGAGRGVRCCWATGHRTLRDGWTALLWGWPTMAHVILLIQTRRPIQSLSIDVGTRLASQPVGTPGTWFADRDGASSGLGPGTPWSFLQTFSRCRNALLHRSNNASRHVQ